MFAQLAASLERVKSCQRYHGNLACNPNQISIIENGPGNANVIHLKLTAQAQQVKIITNASVLEKTVDQCDPEQIVMDFAK